VLVIGPYLQERAAVADQSAVNFLRSKEVLGYPETIRWLERRLQECHPLNDGLVKEQLERARRGEGPTLADTITAMIKIHGPGGDTRTASNWSWPKILRRVQRGWSSTNFSGNPTTQDLACRCLNLYYSD
jgi:hypothetical protein